jgi:hypothetical protein
MNHQVSTPESLVSLNLEVCCCVSQLAGFVNFVEMKGQTAAVDCTNGGTFQKAK